LEFTEAVRLDNNSAAAHYNKGAVLFDLKRYEEARTELEVACKMEPGLSTGFYVLALSERQLGNSSRAAELLEKVEKLDPSNTNALFQLAQILDGLGRTSSAIGYWERVVELNPEHCEALYRLSQAFTKDQPDKAKMYQERLAEVQKRRKITERADLLASFGLTSASARDWPQATTQLEDALKGCKGCRSSANIYKNLGVVYCRAGDVKRGMEQLKLALKQEPDDPEVLSALKIIEPLQRKEVRLDAP
jgi:tetratricopeptide (TPR) repeat protein